MVSVYLRKRILTFRHISRILTYILISTLVEPLVLLKVFGDNKFPVMLILVTSRLVNHIDELTSVEY